MEVTQELLHKLFSYDPETGLFTRKIRNGDGRGKVGEVAGSLSNGYVMLACGGGRMYAAHRLAWLYVYGCWPPKQIDHRNGIRHDNRWVNLRLATRAENRRNTGLQRNNTSGFRGVSKRHNPNKYTSHITVNRKYIHLGSFNTAEEASTAYIAASKHYFGEFHRDQ